MTPGTVEASPRRVASRSDDAATTTDASDVILSVDNLHKKFRGGQRRTVTAVDGVSLDIRRGEFMVLLGPSGCGKTTLLRCLAGLETATSGSIAMGAQLLYSSDARVNVRTQQRRIGMMFQSYALWPHLTVGENVGFPLRVRRVPRSEQRRRIGEILRLVDIEGLADRYPNQLSGGQQQRVALGRSLAVNQDVILFDEPLSNVDAKVREHLRIELLRMQRQLGFAAVHVTHDQTEAMELADRVAVMENGKVVQVGPPEEVYRNPCSPFVGRFLGATNSCVGEVTEVAESHVVVELPFGSLTVDEDGFAVGERVEVQIRPEAIRIVSAGQAPLTGRAVSWHGTVETRLFCGSHCEYVVDVGGSTIRVLEPPSSRVAVGEDVVLRVPSEDLRVFGATGEDCVGR